MPLSIQPTPTSNLTPDQDSQRWRQVIQYVNQLEQRLNSTLPVAARQQGPVPGWLTAGQIGPGAGLKSSMHLNLDGNQQGQSPRQSVTDPNGVVRAEIGNLAVNGISPTQWGFRANDASGTPIFDSLGLISVNTQLGTNFNSAGFSTSGTTPTLVTNSAVTFSLTRSLRVQVHYGASGQYFSPNTQAGIVDLFLDGVNKSAGGNGPALELQYPLTASGAVTSWAMYSTTLAAGSHTFDLRAYQTGTQTFTLLQVATYVFLLGS